MAKSLRIGIFIPVKLLINPPACSLRNVEFLLLHTEHFDKSITFPFFVFTTSRCFLSLFFLHFKE